MAELKTMYDGVANSPDTFLTSALASGGTVLYVADGSVFGTLPNLAVLGTGGNAETILVLEKRSDNGYDIQRAIEGLARDWPQATLAARNFTNYDYEQIRQNFEILNTTKAELIDGKVNPSQLPADKDTTYTAGVNISISESNEISAIDTIYDDTELKTRITAVENREDKDTTYDVATTSANGLMPSTDKAKIDNIEVNGIKVYASTDTIPTLPNGVVALIYEV